ncbi:MAG: protein translocase subunit SecD [Ignavibacteriales bacterium]|nr:protein translocase subunit SecD [Ignavibacteriales bacterium]
MKNNRGKIILILAVFALAIYFLYPTYQAYTIEKKLKLMAGSDSLTYVQTNEQTIRIARAKRIKVGLDLQGGMRVVLEVNVLRMLEEMAKNKDDQFTSIIADIAKEAQTSDDLLINIFRRHFDAKDIRLSRYYGTLRETNNEITKKLGDESDKAVDRAMEIVRNRVDQYGVSEPSIQKQGGRRIIVELPGVSKEEEVRKLLQGTALLEFKLMKDPEIIYKTMDAIDKFLASQGYTDTAHVAKADTNAKRQPQNALAALQKTDSSKTAMNDANKSPEQIRKEHPFLYLVRPNPQGSGEAYVAENDKIFVDRILKRADIQKLLPADMQFYYMSKPAFVDKGVKYFGLIGLKSTPELTGNVVVNARATIDPNFNQPIVTMEMNGEGARDWARITGANVNKRMAIVLDNSVFSAPVIRGKITGGRSQIEGMANIEEARLLEIVLKAGALPAPVDIIEQRSVGPSLGEDSISAGINSFTIALIVTALFMIVYYRTGGMVANIALLLNVLLIFAVLAAFGGTLTLPGIAAIVLTIGMAVDANVLIFERIREESATGKTLRATIDAGYSKAFSAIFDSNITTFFSGVVLFQFGTGPVQGFALTLMMGVTANLFTAITVTRVIFNVMTERGTTTINFG